MKANTLLIIPVTFEKPSIFKTLLHSYKTFSEFDLLISVSSSNKHLAEYLNIFQEQKNKVKINVSDSSNKPILFKDSIDRLDKSELNKYQYLMSVKNFKNEYIHNLYNCIDKINDSDLKLFYPKIKNNLHQESSFSKSEIFIVESNFMRSINLNPFDKFITPIKIFLKTPLKKINLI